MTELEDRLRTATAGLPRLPDDLDEVRARGRRRRWVSRIGTVTVVLAGLVLAGSVALERYDDRPVPTVGEPTDDAPSPSASPMEAVAVVTPGELPWAVITNGPGGVQLWSDGDPELLSADPVATMVWLPESGAVVQTAPGEPIVGLGPGDGDELVGARDELLLRAGGTGPDGGEVLLATWARPAEELGPEIVLGILDVSTRELTELGVVGNREDGPDAIAIDGNELVMATCHLQCTLQVTDVDSPSDGRRLTEADWRGGVAVAADVVATVAFEVDPEAGLPRSGRLVLHDRATGELLREIPLADVDGWAVDVSLTADATAALVTLGDPSDARTYVVDGLLNEPRVRLLEGTGGAVFADQ